MKDLKQQKDEVMELLKLVKESAEDSYEWGDPQENGRNTLIPGINVQVFKKIMDQVESLIDWMWWFK